LLEAAHYLPDNAIVVLVGGSEAEVQSIKSKITTDNVLLVGRQPYAKISYYLAAADVLVLPNKAGDIMSEQYTSPLKMFEYMASGRPIVASDLAGLREILNEENAVLVTPNNSRHLADGLNKVLTDSGLAAALSNQAQKDVKQYSWEKRVKAILNFIG